MSTDALSAIISFGNNIYSSGLSFLVSWSTFVGVAGFALVLASAHSRGNRGGQVYTGKTLLSLFFCAGLTCLKPLVNASGAQFGFEMTSFDSISWAPTSTFGQGAEAVNTLLTYAKFGGAALFIGGLLGFSRVGKTPNVTARGCFIALLVGAGLFSVGALINSTQSQSGLETTTVG